MNSKRLFRLAVGLVFAFSAFSANAADFDSPRTASLGGAGHAYPILNDATYLNPSFISFSPTYAISGNYIYYNGDAAGTNAVGTHGKVWNASVQDGKNDWFTAGAAFSQKETGRLLNIGLSKALFLPQRLSFGLGGKYFIAGDNTGGKSIGDFSLSVTYLAQEWMQLALIADNMLSKNAGRAQGFNREITLGTKFNIQSIILLYIDPHLAPGMTTNPSYGWQAGLEMPVMKDFFLRTGFFRNSNIPELNNTRGRGQGFGAGWIAPRFSLDYAFTRTLEPFSANTHFFGMTVFM